MQQKLVYSGLFVAILLASIALFNKETIIQQIGSSPGPDRDFACESVNGVMTCFSSQKLMATSSVICALRPVNRATSTITSVIVNFAGVGSLGTSNVFDVSTTSQSVGYGSSTPGLIVGATLPSTGYFKWGATGSSTKFGLNPSSALLNTEGPNGEDLGILKPNEWITVRIATATPRTLSSYATGNCSAVFSQ